MYITKLLLPGSLREMRGRIRVARRESRVKKRKSARKLHDSSGSCRCGEDTDVLTPLVDRLFPPDKV